MNKADNGGNDGTETSPADVDVKAQEDPSPDRDTSSSVEASPATETHCSPSEATDEKIPPATTEEEAGGNSSAFAEELNEDPLVLGRLNDLQDEIAAIGSRMDKHLRDTENLSQSTFDRLYKQMRDYKEDFLRKAMKPVFLDLIILYDMLRGIMDSYEGQEKVDVPNLMTNFQALRSELLGVLERQGVEKMVSISDTFDPRTQKALQRESTDDPEKEKKVGARLKDGFILDGLTLRKEVVTVLRYQAPKSQEMDAEPVSEKETE